MLHCALICFSAAKLFPTVHKRNAKPYKMNWLKQSYLSDIIKYTGDVKSFLLLLIKKIKGI